MNERGYLLQIFLYFLGVSNITLGCVISHFQVIGVKAALVAFETPLLVNSHNIGVSEVIL